MTRRLAAAYSLLLLGSCSSELDSLPDPPQVREEPRELEVPLERISLLLAAELGDTEALARLYRSSGRIQWTRDGALAVRVSAKQGHSEAVALLLGYGACSSHAPACYEGLEQAIARGHLGVALQLEAALGRSALEPRDQDARSIDPGPPGMTGRRSLD